MPITQDRLLSVLKAAEFFQAQNDDALQTLREHRLQNPADLTLALLETVLSGRPPGTVERTTILTERYRAGLGGGQRLKRRRHPGGRSLHGEAPDEADDETPGETPGETPFVLDGP